MNDKDRTKAELIHELRELRTRIKNVEASKMELERAEVEIQQARSYAENIVETVREPLLVLDGDLKILSANRSFYQTFKVTPGETLGRLVYGLGGKVGCNAPGHGEVNALPTLTVVCPMKARLSRSAGKLASGRPRWTEETGERDDPTNQKDPVHHRSHEELVLRLLLCCGSGSEACCKDGSPPLHRIDSSFSILRRRLQ